MSRLIVYPGAARQQDIDGDEIIRLISLSAQFKQWAFDPRPDLIESDRFQLGADNEEIVLDGFVNNCIGGVISEEYGVKTIFDSGGHTYFQLIADDKFRANIYDAGEIEDDIPFSWSGRETIAFLLVYSGDVEFYLWFDGIVYSFSASGAGEDKTQEDLTLLSGRYERLDSFEGVGDILEEFENLFKGTSLIGAGVQHDS